MIETLGWISTALVLAGYILNARQFSKSAMVAWIVGDIGWITYDCFIDNYSHLALQKNTIVDGGILSKLSFGLIGKGSNYRFKDYTITNIST